MSKTVILSIVFAIVFIVLIILVWKKNKKNGKEDEGEIKTLTLGSVTKKYIITKDNKVKDPDTGEFVAVVGYTKPGSK